MTNFDFLKNTPDFDVFATCASDKKQKIRKKFEALKSINAKIFWVRFIQ